MPSLREKGKSIRCRRVRFSWAPFQEHLDTDFHLTLIMHHSWTLQQIQKFRQKAKQINHYYSGEKRISVLT